MVFIRGGAGNDGGTVYDPPITSGTFTNDRLPAVGNDNVPEISNITFCGDTPPPPVEASVEVVKVWTLDGDTIAPPEDVAPSFEVTLGGTTRTLTGAGIEVFGGLEDGATYDVDVVEDPDSLPDAEELFGEDCELVSSAVVLSSDTVTAPGSVTATVTNAYSCPDVLDVVLVAVDFEAGKSWFRNTAEGPVEFAEAPTGAAASFEVELRGPEGDFVDSFQLDAG